MTILTQEICECGKEFISAKWQRHCYECQGKKAVYLMGAIEGVSPYEATWWRRYSKKELEAKGYRVIDPTEGKDLTRKYIGEEGTQIKRTDLNSVDTADILLVEMHYPNVGRVGTGWELGKAERAGKRVILWGHQHRHHPFLQEFTEWYDTLEEAIKALKGEGR